MPHINEMKSSKFIKKEDVGDGALVTIKEVLQMNVAQEGAEEDLKWCIVFNESEKPMVLNSTNSHLIAKIANAEHTDGWTGKQIVLYNDPSVSFGGKITGGIRVRAPKIKGVATTQPKIGAVAESPDSGLPF